MARRRVLHIITTVTTGGAEMMLFRLLSAMDRDRYEAEVVCLSEMGPIGERIRELGIPVHALGMSPRHPSPRHFLRLVRCITRVRPAVVQTWMYHSDLIGGLAARLAGVGVVVWGIHNTTLEPGASKRSTRWIVALCARLSGRVPARIVCCAEEAQRIHMARGYAAPRMLTIPNGFDLDAFRPDAAARTTIRRELGLAEDVPVVGLAARFHPQKDHENFIRAAALLLRQRPDARFVLCGDGITWGNDELAGLLREHGLEERFRLLGRREDVSSVTAALDICTSAAAAGEAFPLVVGEAMACGVPCVVTDVGDSSLLVGDTGAVVPPRDPAALAGAWVELLSMSGADRAALGARARARIQEHFALEVIVRRYEALYALLTKDNDSCAA